ncbi:uncharacterized protein LOC106012874 [Aplysia californica]|uniref:Uncharacterized protein LOC106012874 n=1 Tax=Aplysia californica TaxID=6500 RepID=A0ABM1A7U9_APLCA|nr:uncharacterized protein LOC106012874 [Aplysia californica]
MTAYPCASWRDFDSGVCHRRCLRSRDCPVLGLLDTAANWTGSYFLSTDSHGPFCGEDFLVSVQVSRSQGHAYGRLYMTLHDGTQNTGVVDFSRTDRHYHASEREDHVITVGSTLTHVHSARLLFDRGTGLSALGTSHQLAVDSVHLTHLTTNASWALCHEHTDNSTGWHTFTVPARTSPAA